MSLAVVYSRALHGLSAPEVRVEVHLANGLPAFSIVGLPETEVKESRDRVRAALLTANYDFPARKITVNLAPAELPKESGRFDLPIAIGLLVASGQLPAQALDTMEFAGELSLTGALGAVRGSFAMALAAKAAGRSLVIPLPNAAEAVLAMQPRMQEPALQSTKQAASQPNSQPASQPIKNAQDLPENAHSMGVFGASHVLEVASHVAGVALLPPTHASALQVRTRYADLSDIKGQAGPKRALEIAAAGGHSLLMSGPPGSGKSMLAARLPGLMPPMTEAQAMESAALLSVAGKFRPEHFGERPYRAPHHTASAIALVGGGGNPKPGEISLTHEGVLLLDELPEFPRTVLEVLREPIESGRITISRAARQVDYPARFQLVAAMNPCPCGYLGHATRSCRCTPDQVARYRGRLSGPLLDRIDLSVDVPPISADDLTRTDLSAESSEVVRARVAQAYATALARQGVANAALDPKGIEAHCTPDSAGDNLLKQAMARLSLSARAYHRVLKVARTVADLAGREVIGVAQVAEALQYRRGLEQGIA
jgi:magnesium chelatase family protein